MEKGGKTLGRNIPLSVPRRLVCDLLRYSKVIPTIPTQRRMNIARVQDARAALPRDTSPRWCAIFAKAYGITAKRFPDLRRTFMGFPSAHLYEHPYSMASVTVEREHKGETAVFMSQLRRPESQSLWQLQENLRRFKEDPIDSIHSFQRALRIGKLPAPIRRVLWWLALNFSGRKRAAYLGTFGISVYSSLGAESLHPMMPVTTTLNYGPIGPDGDVAVRIVYDHRVMDGGTVARALACLEDVLNQEIVTELRQANPMRIAS